MTNDRSGFGLRSGGLDIFCIVMGGVGFLGALGSGVELVRLWARGAMDPLAAGLMMGVMAACMALGALCIAVSQLVQMAGRRIEQGELQSMLLQQIRTTPAATASALAPAPANVAPAALAHGHGHEEKHSDLTRGQILELLQHLRDAAMMDEGQRRECAARHWAKRKEALVQLIERHMLSGDWAMARSRLEDLQSLLPTDGEVQTLGERLAAEHASRLGEDLTTARAQLRRLVSLTAWQEAEEIVNSLQHKYPHDEQVQRLNADVAHEREKQERENRERLLSELADATENRQWRRAIGAAEDFVQRYPKDNVTERLQFDLPTLRENATTQDRKEQEGLFKDLLKRQHYEEAEQVAKLLIERYPHSSTATELMKMLPRVEELHRQEALKRQLAGAAAGD